MEEDFGRIIRAACTMCGCSHVLNSVKSMVSRIYSRWLVCTLVL